MGHGLVANDHCLELGIEALSGLGQEGETIKHFIGFIRVGLASRAPLLKIEAFDRFINLNTIALGVLQVLALDLPKQVWTAFPLWFRTLPKHGYRRVLNL